MNKEEQIKEFRNTICHLCDNFTDCGIKCQAYRKLPEALYNAGYRKLSEIAEQEAEITPISEKFYALFMQYYKEKAIKGLFAVRIKTDEYERYIKPRANCNGYYYGYRLEHIVNYPSVQKEWAFPFERAYLYSVVYNGQIIPIA